MDIKLFNTESRQLEIFKPIKDGEVSLYTCGPTVYHFAHIGNLRTYVSQDIMKRMFMANGYDVKHIMNITDVGHLTDDGNDGEDKMEKGSLREGKSVWDVAKFYTDAFMKDVLALNILPPLKYTKATDYISEQIELVQDLEKLGYTYEIENDGIYYDTSKLSDYGRLGGQNLEELQAGARVALSDGKRNVPDFALWKFSPKDEQRQMEWDSPWGKGFPGWHIECSAMCLKELGGSLDIHSGGVDHIKIHHTNEIAQVEPVIGRKWVNYWVHMEFLNDNSGKMSKSNGEFLTLTRLGELGYSPIVYRYFLLLAGYRKQLNFSYELLDGAKKSYENLLKKVVETLGGEAVEALAISESRLGAVSLINSTFEIWKNRILGTLNDDMNTAGVIVILQELLKSNDDEVVKYKVVEFIDELLGLKFIENAKLVSVVENEEVPAEVVSLADGRVEAKKSRNFEKADALRGQILEMGFVVEDKADGTYEIKKI